MKKHLGSWDVCAEFETKHSDLREWQADSINDNICYLSLAGQSTMPTPQPLLLLQMKVQAVKMASRDVAQIRPNPTVDPDIVDVDGRRHHPSSYNYTSVSSAQCP